MALPDSFKQVVGTAIVLGNSATHAPANLNNLGADTDQIDLTSLGANAYRQSTKFDFTANRASLWFCKAALEWATAPVAGTTVDIYLGFSSSATAATDNPANLSGADSAYTGYSSNADEAVLQLDYIGSFVVTVQVTGTIQVAHVGTFSPRQRYASCVVHNNTADALHSDVVEMSILLAPIEEQIQD